MSLIKLDMNQSYMSVCERLRYTRMFDEFQPAEQSNSNTINTFSLPSALTKNNALGEKERPPYPPSIDPRGDLYSPPISSDSKISTPNNPLCNSAHNKESYKDIKNLLMMDAWPKGKSQLVILQETENQPKKLSQKESIREWLRSEGYTEDEDNKGWWRPSEKKSAESKLSYNIEPPALEWPDCAPWPENGKPNDKPVGFIDCRKCGRKATMHTRLLYGGNLYMVNCEGYHNPGDWSKSESETIRLWNEANMIDPCDRCDGEDADCLGCRKWISEDKPVDFKSDKEIHEINQRAWHKHYMKQLGYEPEEYRRELMGEWYRTIECATVDQDGKHCPEPGVHEIFYNGKDAFLCEKCLRRFNSEINGG